MALVFVDGIVRHVQSFYRMLGNRRKFDRTPVSGTILVTTKGRVIDTTHTCSCVDLSPRGLGIDCPEPLAVDAIVQVHAGERDPRSPARVRFCRKLGDVYRVGLQFYSASMGEPRPLEACASVGAVPFDRTAVSDPNPYTAPK